MPQKPGEPDVRSVGRDGELALLNEFVSAEPVAAGFVLTGEPGIGKTTLWEAGVAFARERRLRILLARPSGAEAQHSFAALIDLFDGVGAETLTALAVPQRRALETALLRSEPTGGPPEPHAIGVGVLNALRALAAHEPVLVAIDDLQWLDRPSAGALAYAARRLDGEAVGFLLARRPGDPSVLEKALERWPLERVEVDPLSLGATRRLLLQRLGLTVTRPLLRRIFDATLGNPLFALEIGRMLAGRGPLEIGEDVPVPDAVEDLLGARVAQLAGPVRRLLLAVALGGDLSARQVAALAESAALEDAVAAGVLLVEGNRVRPSHPLLAAAAKKHSRARDRRQLHLELSRAVVDEELRAFHLALATELPDEELAALVAAAAAGAAARGSAPQAVVLAEHALRLTAAESAEHTDRLVALGAYLHVAGEKQRLTELLAPALDSLPRGGPRVRALQLLTGGEVGDNDEIRDYLERALAASGGDPRLRAPVLAQLAGNDAVIRVERIREAESWALEALGSSAGAAPEVEQSALYALSWARSLRGVAIDDLCDRVRAVTDGDVSVSSSPERVAGQRHVWRGEAEQARAILTRLLVLADVRGEPYSYALHRLHVCELELRLGEWAAATRLLDEWAESSDRELVIWPMYERCRALLAAGQGDPAAAERWATEAIARADATGVRWDVLEALRARGTAALLAHDPARAAESLRAVWAHTGREGVDEPGVFPVAPELVEALVELGELDEARAVGERLQELAAKQEHPWGLASAARCNALVRLAGPTWDETAAEELALAGAAYGRLGLRFDRARSLLALGRAQRRWRKWAAARRSLEEAVTAFEELGSDGWAEQVRSELARVGARPPRPPGELTPTELRVAELAAEGLSNKEIARTLFVTPHTIEAHLTRAYAKLGIRSRTQLARRLSILA